MKSPRNSFLVSVLIDALHSGGVEKVALNQVLNLNKIGVKSNLVVLRRTDYSNHPFKELIHKVPIVFLDDLLPPILRTSFKVPFFSFLSLYHFSYPILLPFVIAKKELGLVISHGTYTCFSAILFRLTKGVDFYAYIWDPIYYILQKVYLAGPIHIASPILLPVARIVDWVIVKSAKGVLVGGKSHVNYLKSLGAQNVNIIYPGIEPLKKISTKKNYLVSVTAWKEGKNPEYNLEIISQLTNSRLVMAGSWYPSQLERDFRDQVRKSGLAHQVEVKGKISETDLKRLYSKALVFLQTHDDRGFGLSTLEAASCGTTFVIPEGQGVCELFENGVDGYFLPEHDTTGIVKKLALLLANPSQSKAMGEHAWKKVVANYSWEKHALAIANLIKGERD